MIFRAHVIGVLPKFTLRSRETPKLRGHALGVYECVIAPENDNTIRHFAKFAHDRDIAYAIAIAKIDRSRLESCSQHQLVTRFMVPGVQTPKMGIGSGHRRVPNTRQYDVESKMLDKISHGGASTVNKSTTVDSPTNRVHF